VKGAYAPTVKSTFPRELLLVYFIVSIGESSRASNIQSYVCRAPLLRCLRLKSCYGTNEVFGAAITNFPLLEEFDLDQCYGMDDAGVFEHVARSCPRMKHITYIKYQNFDSHITDNDRLALAIARMPELRTLQLFRDNKLTNTGLASIVDNCPHLELLDLRSCPNITMDDAMRAKCSRIKRKTLLPYFEDMRDKIQTSSAIRFWPPRTSGSCYIGGNDSVPKESSNSYCYYLGEDDEINLEYYDSILDKSMRRYKM
jgi:hypothetical protein